MVLTTESSAIAMKWNIVPKKYRDFLTAIAFIAGTGIHRHRWPSLLCGNSPQLHWIWNELRKLKPPKTSKKMKNTLFPQIFAYVIFGLIVADAFFRYRDYKTQSPPNVTADTPGVPKFWVEYEHGLGASWTRPDKVLNCIFFYGPTTTTN